MIKSAHPVEEYKDYLETQILTCLGNKRKLLPFIGEAVAEIKRQLGKKDKLTCFDVFSGSGIVARYLKQYARELYVNDLESYSRVINQCYLTNMSHTDMDMLRKLFCELYEYIEANQQPGFITELYAPRCEARIQKTDRVFFTRRNAIYLDTARKAIDMMTDERFKPFFIAPLLCEASVHSNTGGVFKGFYKNKRGIGQYGGEGRNALSRIQGNIFLRMPVFSAFDCPYTVFQEDAADAALKAPFVDMAYLDPPYNQHPYGSNYFMLNLIAQGKRPQSISKVSGIPAGWNRSVYNKSGRAQQALFDLIKKIKAQFLLISYNSEGFISYLDFRDFLSSTGKLQEFKTEYPAFRASRNLSSRNLKVTEYLFLLEKY